MSKSLIYPNQLKQVYHKLIFTDDASGAFTLKKSNSDSAQDDITIEQITVDIVGNVTGTITGNTSGTHTGAVVGDVEGDITGDITGNADTVTQGVYKISDQTIGGVKTFTETIIGNLQGNVTGDITGNIGGGDFTGNPIGDAYIASADTWNSKMTSDSALTNFVDFSASGARGSTDKLLISTGSDEYKAEDITSYALTLMGDETAADARSTLGVDVAGTDNSTNVTIKAGLNYITIAGQLIELGKVNLATDIEGSLADGNITSSAAWDAKLDSAGSITNQDFPQFDSGGNLIGLSASELRSALGLQPANLVDWTVADAGDIHQSNLPRLAITNVFSKDSEVGHLALDTEEGDVVVRTDENQTYIKNDGTSDTMADWTQLATPTDAVTSVDGSTGVVTLNHDTLTGFVTNEHVDWTSDVSVSKMIHGANIEPMGFGNTYAQGLVPAGTAVHTDKYLRRDGTWQYDTWQTLMNETDLVIDKGGVSTDIELIVGSNGRVSLSTAAISKSIEFDPNSKELYIRGSSSGAHFLINQADADVTIKTMLGDSEEDGDMHFISQGIMTYNANLSQHKFLYGGDNSASDFIEFDGTSGCSIIMTNIGTGEIGLTTKVDILTGDVLFSAGEGHMTLNSPSGKKVSITEDDGLMIPTSDNHITNKAYVDAGITSQLTYTTDSVSKAKMFALIF